jgi:catechol 2,3-dioxygenase-like lactoylglutathione lyase family enzyme
MELKFSHVDVRVKNLEETCAYYAQILKARIKKRSLIPTDKLTAGVALQGSTPFFRRTTCPFRITHSSFTQCCRCH